MSANSFGRSSGVMVEPVQTPLRSGRPHAVRGIAACRPAGVLPFAAFVGRSERRQPEQTDDAREHRISSWHHRSSFHCLNANIGETAARARRTGAALERSPLAADEFRSVRPCTISMRTPPGPSTKATLEIAHRDDGSVGLAPFAVRSATFAPTLATAQPR